LQQPIAADAVASKLPKSAGLFSAKKKQLPSYMNYQLKHGMTIQQSTTKSTFALRFEIDVVFTFNVLGGCQRLVSVGRHAGFD